MKQGRSKPGTQQPSGREQSHDVKNPSQSQPKPKSQGTGNVTNQATTNSSYADALRAPPPPQVRYVPPQKREGDRQGNTFSENPRRPPDDRDKGREYYPRRDKEYYGKDRDRYYDKGRDERRDFDRSPPAARDHQAPLPQEIRASSPERAPVPMPDKPLPPEYKKQVLVAVRDTAEAVLRQQFEYETAVCRASTLLFAFAKDNPLAIVTEMLQFVEQRPKYAAESLCFVMRCPLRGLRYSYSSTAGCHTNWVHVCFSFELSEI